MPRPLFVPCLSALLAAGAFVSPSLAQTPPQSTSEGFGVEPTQLRLPSDALPLGIRFEAQGDRVALLSPEDSDAYDKAFYTVIVPGDRAITYTFLRGGTQPWSQTIGKTTTFTFHSTSQEVRLTDDAGATVLLLQLDQPINNPFLLAQRSFTLINEQGNLVIIKRGLMSSSKAETVESEPVPILKLTYAAGQSASDAQSLQSETAVPRTVAPAVPGTYDLTYHDAKGNVLQHTVVTVWKSADGALINPLGAPYRVTEYSVDENGKRLGAERIYYVGGRYQYQPPQDLTLPKNTVPPVRRPSPSPKFRLIHDNVPAI